MSETAEKKTDVAKEFTRFITQLVQKESDKENPYDDDFREGIPETTDNSSLPAQEYTGYAICTGPWILHLFEAENPLMKKIVNGLVEAKRQKGGFYQNMWVIHFTEDIPARAYPSWYCKDVKANVSGREIKTLPFVERLWAIYESMVQVGTAAQNQVAKGEQQVSTALKQGALENVPIGQDELQSLVSEEVLSIEQWSVFAYETPEICLEKEMQWPDDHDLIY